MVLQGVLCEEYFCANLATHFISDVVNQLDVLLQYAMPWKKFIANLTFQLFLEFMRARDVANQIYA